MHNYLFQLREGLQYSLRNLTTENFNAAALQKLTDDQKSEFTEELKKLSNLMSQFSGKLDSLTGRVAGIEGLVGRMTAAEQEISYIDKRVTDSEVDIVALQGNLASVETDLKTQDARVKALEEKVPNLENYADELETLQNVVTGEGGLLERLDDAQNDIKRIDEAVRIAEDGSVAVGAEGKVLRLVGEIYINGVLYGQGGAT